MRRQRLDAPAANDVGLCVNEAMANVTRHAYSGAIDRPVEVAGEPLPGGGVRITIRDWGNGVNPDDVARAEPSPDTPGGLGLICMQHSSTTSATRPSPTECSWRLRSGGEGREGSGVRSQESGVVGRAVVRWSGTLHGDSWP